jgi:uncharacterized protein YdaU (DUF1376 family)
MAKDPAVLFYTSDFISGTAFFNDEQRGQYILLLCQQHQLGKIPKNHMINVCKSSDSPVITKFKIDQDGFYYNERMRVEAEKRKTFCLSRSNNKSGRPKKESHDNHMINIRKSHDNHMENDNANGDFNTTTLNKAISFNFEDLWSKYPNRVGKKDALKHFKATVKTEKDFDDIHTALGNYLTSSRVIKGFVQNGSTFFNNWRDWVDYKEDLCSKCKGNGKYLSATNYEIACDCPKGKDVKIKHYL